MSREGLNPLATTAGLRCPTKAMGAILDNSNRLQVA